MSIHLTLPNIREYIIKLFLNITKIFVDPLSSSYDITKISNYKQNLLRKHILSTIKLKFILNANYCIFDVFHVSILKFNKIYY